MFTLSNSLFINADAMASLQIMGSENHPNHMNQGPDNSKSGAKESLSLYGLFHVLTRTAQGKQRLRQMFLRPSVDLDLIHERQRTITAFLRPENSEAIDLISRRLRKIKNIKTYLVLLKRGANLASGQNAVARGTWATLQSFSAYSIELRDAIRTLSGAEQLEITHKASLPRYLSRPYSDGRKADHRWHLLN